ncbi:MAG: hypothetical protein ACRDQZ_00165 [Mycobacteriales bacterium]
MPARLSGHQNGDRQKSGSRSRPRERNKVGEAVLTGGNVFVVAWSRLAFSVLQFAVGGPACQH